MSKLDEAIELATSEVDESKEALIEKVELLRNEMNRLLQRLQAGKPFSLLNEAQRGGEIMRLGAVYQERLDALTRLHEIRGSER
jgi:hypothetical protein